MSDRESMQSINRNIVECKDECLALAFRIASRINRNIVECKEVFERHYFAIFSPY